MCFRPSRGYLFLNQKNSISPLSGLSFLSHKFPSPLRVIYFSIVASQTPVFAAFKCLVCVVKAKYDIFPSATKQSSQKCLKYTIVAKSDDSDMAHSHLQCLSVISGTFNDMWRRTYYIVIIMFVFPPRFFAQGFIKYLFH